jgi:hypothetical protein
MIRVYVDIAILWEIVNLVMFSLGSRILHRTTGETETGKEAGASWRRLGIGAHGWTKMMLAQYLFLCAMLPVSICTWAILKCNIFKKAAMCFIYTLVYLFIYQKSYSTACPIL